MKEYVVHIKVSGEGAHTMTPEELQKAISFGLNWGHGHKYTDANFHVTVHPASPNAGVNLPDGAQHE